MLDRRVARLQDHGQGLRRVADHAPRSAEVEQQGLQLWPQQQDIVRRDITVVAVIGVNDLQGFEQRNQQMFQPGFIGWCLLLQKQFQCRAGVKRHDHVGRAVLLPEAIDLDQRWMVERSEQPSLVDEAAQAKLEGFAMSLRAHQNAVVGAAAGKRGRDVFLQCHLALQQHVLDQVDDAETAFTDHPDDFELVQAIAGRQRVVASAD